MADAGITRASGQLDEAVVNQFRSLITSTNIRTLRELLTITSNALNNQLNPRTATPNPDSEEFNKLFTYVTPASFFNSGFTDTNRTLRSSSNQNGTGSDLLDRLRLELDSLGLDQTNSTSKVRTKWLLNPGTDTTHAHLKNAGNIDSFPAICQLRDKITNLSQCQGTMTGCIVNCYRDNGARTRPHADDESYIDQSSSICTLSLGETREIGIFANSHRDPKKLKTFELHSGSVFMMHPGSQAKTKHRVFPKKPNQTNISIDGIRYSISFRSFNAGPTVATGVQAAVETSDINDKIDTTIIFGSSIPKRLDCKKLAGRSGKSVINLAVGGAKIPDMLKHMDQFFSGEHQYFQTEDAIPIDNMDINNVIFSVGTNDVLKIRHRVSSLYIPIQNLLRKAKAMFQCKIHFQGLIPIPNQPRETAQKVYEFNEMAIKACRSERCFYLEVISKFLECTHFEKFFIVKRNGETDIHPNRLGNSILARMYIAIVRDYFNPHNQS